MPPVSAVAESLAAACRMWSDRPAVTHRGRTLTYTQLGRKIDALAAAYRAMGIGGGDRIVCQLPPSTEHIIALAAAWACGAVHVGAHPELTGRELALLAAETEATALVFEPRALIGDPLAPLRAATEARPGLQVIVHGTDAHEGQRTLAAMLETPGLAAAEAVRGNDMAVLLRTSGTTGLPKLVIETVPALWAKMAFFADAIRPTPDDVHLMYLPVAHAFGMKLCLMALATGGRLVLLDRFSPEQALQIVGDERVTVLPGTPTHYALLLRSLDTRRHQVGSLRWAVTAAAPLQPALAGSMRAQLGVDIAHVYGCSEGFLTMTTDGADLRDGSVGSRVFRGPPGSPPDGSVTVLDLENDSMLPRDEVGEIAYGARHPVRYWRAPSVATGGWYRTGDTGWLDERGRVFIRGRLKELINRGGLKVACGEIEGALRLLPDVGDCAVIATPDPILGEAICACVVPAGETVIDLSELRASLGETLARHKLPDELCVMRELPRSSIGKLDRAALIALVVDGALPRSRARGEPRPSAGVAGGHSVPA